MRKNIIKHSMLIIFAICTFSYIPIHAEEYADVPNDWSRKSVIWAYEQDIMTGSGGYIRPDDNINRAELATMLVRLFDVQTTADIRHYTDVRQIAWYYPFIQKSVSADIMTGAYGQFRPMDTVTREEASVAIARAFDYKSRGNEAINFNDFESISGWARESVKALYEREIMMGYETGNFCPKNNITRKEVAAILYRCKNRDITPITDNDGTTWTTVY